MNKIGLSIIIIGKMRSGKSTLADDFSKWLNIPKISFGRYLREYIKSTNLDPARTDLQDLGDRLINENALDFLDNVIISNNHSGDKVIFEGVRHQIIFNGIKERSLNTLSIYLDVSDDVRLSRFLESDNAIDVSKKNQTGFDELSSHPVEKEIGDLKDKCDYTIVSNKSYQEFLKMFNLYN
jgi:adenylate kinase family enzyme